MNAPTLYDRFIVPEGQRKVSFVAETKVASAGTFTVQREDHTLGNLIRMCVRRARAAACGGALGGASRGTLP
jgi:DNA-directed RNA polymerase II subunit RPB11